MLSEVQGPNALGRQKKSKGNVRFATPEDEREELFDIGEDSEGEDGDQRIQEMRREGVGHLDGQS